MCETNEVNIAVTEAGIKVSSKLLRLANIV